MTPRERFRAAYREAIERAVLARPDDYAPIPDFDAFAERWTVACERGHYNHGGLAMRWTCKALGIPHTRTAIAAFLGAAAVPARSAAPEEPGTVPLVQGRTTPPVRVGATGAPVAGPRVILTLAQDATATELRRALLAENALAPTVGLLGDELRRARLMGVAVLPGERRSP